MVRALKQVKIRGEIRTIVDYTTEMIQHEAFVGNQHHTGWLDSRIAAHVSVTIMTIKIRASQGQVPWSQSELARQTCSERYGSMSPGFASAALCVWLCHFGQLHGYNAMHVSTSSASLLSAAQLLHGPDMHEMSHCTHVCPATAVRSSGLVPDHAQNSLTAK